MPPAMEVDVKAEQADCEMDGEEPTEPTAMMMDKVTLLQESVDKMALSMFNALRLLPATVGDGDNAKKEETVTAVRSPAWLLGLSVAI